MPRKAIELFYQLKTSDKVTTVLLLNACARIGSDEALQMAKKAMSALNKFSMSDSVLITSYIDVLMKCSDVQGAESVFNQWKHHETPVFGAMMKGELSLHWSMPSPFCECVSTFADHNHITQK